jgi:hypothetical protein
MSSMEREDYVRRLSRMHQSSVQGDQMSFLIAQTVAQPIFVRIYAYVGMHLYI